MLYLYQPEFNLLNYGDIIIKDQGVRDIIEKGNVEKAIEENDIVLLLLPNQSYSEKIKDIAVIVSKTGKKICYVSVNKPFETLLKDFEKNRIDHKKFYIIDCVTKNVGGASPADNVVCVSSPKALTEMNIAIKNVLETAKTEITMFDSLSTLLIYEDPHVVIRFVHSIVSMFRALKSKGILISLKDDIQSELIKDLNMFVDKVVEMG